MVSRFVNKIFLDINEINLFMSANPTYVVFFQNELPDGTIRIKFKVQCK